MEQDCRRRDGQQHVLKKRNTLHTPDAFRSLVAAFEHVVQAARDQAQREAAQGQRGHPLPGPRLREIKAHERRSEKDEQRRDRRPGDCRGADHLPQHPPQVRTAFLVVKYS